MESRDVDTDRDLTVDAEEPTRPQWLLTDPTDAIDEPVTGGPYEPPPSMVIDAPVAAPAAVMSTSTGMSTSPRRAALVGALAGAVAAAVVATAVVAITDDDGRRSVAPISVANGQ